MGELSGTRGPAEIRAAGIKHPARGDSKDTGLESRMRGGEGLQGRDPAPKLPVRPVPPFPAVCLGLPENRGVSDQPSFPKREALTSGSQSILNHS